MILVSVLNALAFVIVATGVAAACGLILGYLVSLPALRIDILARRAPLERTVGLLVDVSLSLFENIPVVAILLVLSLLPGETAGRALLPGRLFAFAMIAGLFWSAGPARLFSSIFTAETRRVYPLQMRIWGASRRLVLTSILRENKRQIAAGLLGVAVYALIVDSGVSYVMSWSTTFQALPFASYYGSTIGALLATLYHGGSTAWFWTLLLGEIITITAGLQLVRSLGALPPGEAVQIEHENLPVNRFEFSLETSIPGVVPRRYLFGRPSKEHAQGPWVSLKIGDVLWIRGESGSGKSLLLKTLFQSVYERHTGIRLLPPAVGAEGKLRAKHEQSFGLPLLLLLPQEPAEALFPFLTVRELADRCGFSKGQRTGLVEKYLQRSVERLWDKYPAQMSAGEKRQVAIALLAARLGSTLSTPPLLLLDEPDASLDARHTEAIIDQITTFGGKGAVLLFSHGAQIGSLLKKSLDSSGRCLMTGHMQRSQAAPTLANSGSPTRSRQATIPMELGQDLALDIEGLQPPGYLEGLSYPGSIVEQGKRPEAIGDHARIVGLCGPNGCGKSTMLRAIAGLVPRGRRGSVQVNGCPVHKLSAAGLARHHVAYLYDDSERSLPPGARIGPIIRSLARSLPRNTRASRLEAFESFFEEFVHMEMDELRNRTVWELSGGERQVLAFLVAVLLQSAPILLLDEPFSRLDTTRKFRLGHMIREGCFGSPRLFLIASHDKYFLNEFSDSLYVLPEESPEPYRKNHWDRYERVREDTYSYWLHHRWSEVSWKADHRAHFDMSTYKWVETK